MTTISVQVAASIDNSEQQSNAQSSGRSPGSTGTVVRGGSPYVGPGSHGFGNLWSVAFLFGPSGLGIPQGATINSAELTIFAWETYAAPNPKVIEYFASLQKSFPASGLGTSPGDLGSAARPRTTAFSTIVVTSVVQNTGYTVDITTSVAEMVADGSWTTSMPLVALLDTHPNTTDDEWQNFWTYGGDPAYAATLDVDYTAAGGVPFIPSRGPNAVYRM